MLALLLPPQSSFHRNQEIHTLPHHIISDLEIEAIGLHMLKLSFQTLKVEKLAKAN